MDHGKSTPSLVEKPGIRFILFYVMIGNVIVATWFATVVVEFRFDGPQSKRGNLVECKDVLHNATTMAGGGSFEYVPAPVEQYILDHARELGYASDRNPSGCTLWKDPNATTPELHRSLLSYGRELEHYNALVRDLEPIPDHRPAIETTPSNNHENVCSRTRLHPDGLKALFPSQQLSLTKSGYVEPLTPPQRSHSFCWDSTKIMSMDYLLHDFEAMCQRLKPTSKTILIDMGASLQFHEKTQPIVTLMELYEKFGFPFDHIYAFEITFTKPEKVYEQLLPSKYLASYHWINVAVDPTEGAKMNPLHSILKQFDEDDLIVVKLDVDSPKVENALVQQLLDDEVYHKLVDHFYFEHHVHLGELAPYWKRSMDGTIRYSLELFRGLREKGVPTHFWP